MLIVLPMFMYEYKYESIALDRDITIKRLNELGLLGWKVITSLENGSFLLLKRQRNNYANP